MADINLGQISAVWLDESEPPHKNCVWIKTINLLTSEKAGYIWNGIEWVNIQGLGFTWKGVFDFEVNYTKNDVVKFEDILYIKLNDIVNNEDNPDENDDFDLFLPVATPTGDVGSVQIKDANGRFFGSGLLTWLAGLLSILGNVFIKGLSATLGNALEVRNSNNEMRFAVANAGTAFFQKWQGIYEPNTRIEFSGDGHYIGFNAYAGFAFYRDEGVDRSAVAVFNSSIYLNRRTFINDLRVSVITTGADFDSSQTSVLKIKGEDAILLPANPGAGQPVPFWSEVSRGILLQDGKPRNDLDGQGYGGAGIKMQSWGKVAGTEPVLNTLFEVKEGEKIGLYGVEPVARQVLSANPTNEEISTVLFNIGAVIRP